MKNVFYNLRKELFFQDGNSVGEDVLLKILDSCSGGSVKLETVGEHNVKRIFWTKKEDLKINKNNKNGE
jgi:hypothetical protein